MHLDAVQLCCRVMHLCVDCNGADLLHEAVKEKSQEDKGFIITFLAQKQQEPRSRMQVAWWL